MLSATAAQARTFEVIANPDMTFTPSTLTIHQYDRIVFRNGGGVHNVVADDNRFRCAVNCNTNTAPSALAWSAGVQFTQLGSIGHYCEQHGNTTSGMRGLIVVIDRVFVDGFEVVSQASDSRQSRCRTLVDSVTIISTSQPFSGNYPKKIGTPPPSPRRRRLLPDACTPGACGADVRS